VKRLVFALTCVAGVAAADPYPAQLLTLDQTDYHSVELRNDIRATVRAGDAQSGVVDYTGTDPDQLIVQQFGEWLRLDRNTRWLIWTNGRDDQFSVDFEMAEVRELKALSGAEITADLGEQDRFRAEAENGIITVSVDTPNLRLRGNDNAVITVSGTCGRLTMLARPTATVDLNALTCDSIVIFGDKTRVSLPEGANVVDEHPADF